MDVTRKSPSPERAAGAPGTDDPVGVLARVLATRGIAAGSHLCLAFSGGLDSTALLHALVELRPALGYHLTAVHVDHGLHAAAVDWAAHCGQAAARLDVPLEVLKVSVGAAGGLEAAARSARYAALAGVACDHLVLAQHRDDQAETVLLALLRGAGPAGLAAMGEAQVRPGHPLGRPLLRPWLELDRATLLDWARARKLCWIEDPSNQDTRLDRNFLRHAIGPQLGKRFPGWRVGLARSAQWAAEAQQLLEELAQQDLGALDTLEVADPALLPGSCVAWRALPQARARNLLRCLLSARGLPAPPAARLAEWLRQLNAAADRLPELVWGAQVMRRWGNRLWIETVLPVGDWPESLIWPGNASHPLQLPDGSRLAFEAVTAAPDGIAARVLLRADCGPLRIARCSGSATLRLHAGGPSRNLRKVFQEAGVPPWRRRRMPGLLAGRELAAVAGLAVAAEFQPEPGSPAWRILWHDAACGASTAEHGQLRPLVV